MTAAIAPGRRRATSAMARPRSPTSQAPSATERTPAATSAVYSPRLWPATATTRASDSRLRSSDHASREAVNTDICAWSVRDSVSWSAVSSSSATSKPEARETDSTSSQDSVARQGSPIPGR